MPDRPSIPWKRWWTPLGGPVHLEQAGGFLSDPLSEFGHLYPLNVFPLDDLLQRHCVILCGEPGIGKTTELDELEMRLTTAGTAPEVLRVNFRSCLDGADFHNKVFESPKWATWLGSNDALLLIIDGVDEGLWLAPSFLEWFIEKLSADLPLDRLSVILACRTLEWPQPLGAQLAALWGEPKPESQTPPAFQFELCPLTRSAVIQAADAYDVPPDDFLRAVHERQVHGLAARPLTLFMLLDEFRERGGNLTRTHRQLYLDFCKRLCEEPDALRAQRLRRRKVAWFDLRSSQKQVIAGRIAAMMFLTAKSSVIKGTGLERASTDLTSSDIAVGTENDGAGDFAVTNDLVEATLATGLFNSKGGSRVGFEHQTFAECLAAQYLAKIDFAPLRTLLLRRDVAGEYVVPQLAELASWLAGERDDIFDLLLTTQPEILLRSDLSHLGNARKEQVIDALLRKAANAEFFERHDERRPFYAALNHPRLASQLRPVILDRGKNNVVRWLAIDIASACKCREVLDAILAILKRRKDTITLQAGYALDDLVDDQSAPLLIPVADGSFVPEPARSVRVTALRALVSTIWSVADALPIAVKIVRSADFLDWYLAERARPSDVKEGLKVIADLDRIIFDSLFRLRRVAMRLLELAADQLEDVPVRELVATILLKGLRTYQIDGWTNAGGLGKVLTADREKRRLVIRALHQRINGGNADRWQLASLCLPEDVPWLLDLAVTSRGAERRANLELASALLRPDFFLPHWDDVIDRLRKAKALKPIKQLFDAYRLNSAQAKAARAAHMQREEKRLSLQRDLARRKLPERGKRIKTVLTFRQENVWIGLRDALFINDAREWTSGVASHDIEHSPGWIVATDAERQQFREIARQFLLNHSGEFICHPNQSTYGADAAFAAAWLLRDELKKPGKLQDAFAQKCVLAVAWHFAADDAEAELTALIYSLNPNRCREAYIEKMDFDAARDSGLTLAARPFLTCWNSDLTSATADFLLRKIRRSDTIRSVLTELARADLPAVPKTWRGIVRRAARQGKPGVARAAAASELMIELFVEEYWNELFPFLCANRDLTRLAVLCSSAFGPGYNLKPTQSLTEEHLASLYLLLYGIFSPSDPEEQWGDSGEPRELTSRHNAARFRDSLVDRLVAKGTPAASNAMRRVVNGVKRDHRLWMKKRWLDCVELVRRKAWMPLEPEQLLEIARRRNAFWVENEDDLMLVLSESLDELQRSLRNSPTGDVLDFWNYERHGGRVSAQKPKAEVDVARKIYAWLQQRLGSRHGAIIQREVTIQWDQRRTDIEVIVTRNTPEGASQIGVVLEVKHAWNSGVRVDAYRQLRDRYLKRTGRTRGIYVVTWFESDLWRPRRRMLKSRSLVSAKDEIAAICGKAAKLPIIIAPYVLDCSFPT